jgi:TolB-like protein
VVIKAGTKSAAIAVQVTDNGANEDDKTVVVSMGAPTHGVRGRTTTSTVTIINADPVPAVSFGSARSRGEEKKRPVRIKAVLSAASGRPVTVEYGVAGGTAISGKDYSLPGGVLTFLPGETLQEIMIDVNKNGFSGGDRTIELVLRNPNNAVPGESMVHTHTIPAGAVPPKPTIAFTSEGQRLSKQARTVAVTVQLSTVSARDVIVPFSVTGTAVQGKDYIIMPSPVVIKAGERTAAVLIVLKDEVPVETDKAVDIKLSNPDNALLGKPGVYRLVIVKDTIPSIAVVPFFNVSNNKNAGDIMTLQFVKELIKLKSFVVIEPGVVRQQFLDMRVVMIEGISSADIDLISENVAADLILTGKVTEYQDYEDTWGKPRVDFYVMLIARDNKRIVWSSKSNNSGDDGVTLFDWGTVNTANAMVSEMANIVRKMMVE